VNPKQLANAESTTIKLGEHHSEFALFHEGYVRHYIALADTKAAWCFTVAAGALAFVFGRTASRTELLDPQWSWGTGVVWGATVFLLLSALFSFLVIRPRPTTSSHHGIIFFVQIANKANASTYISDVAGHSKSTLTAARLEHCYDISRVCASKYASIRRAIWFGLVGLALTLLQLLWVRVASTG
jgi:hypothetical protein